MAPLIPNVKNVIPVASGKGGVGKSTVSANLALALAKTGAKVGIMDADVYGPSIPTILGITEKPIQKENRLIPVTKYGIKVISMGFFVPTHEAVIWRGPMLHKMVQDFLGVVDWGELDYLIVDLPPGTGDIQLSLCQTIPLAGAVIVSTPQDVAWNVAQKAILMFDKLNAPVLGVIENMTGDVFGKGGAKRAAERLGIPYLGDVPLSAAIRQAGDKGEPCVEPFGSIVDNLRQQVHAIRTNPLAKPVPSKYGPLGGPTLEVEWIDGQKTSYVSRELRLACPCAGCVNEMTGERMINPASLRPDVAPVAVNPVGRYAVQIVWNDGHNTGLYAYDYLRRLAFSETARKS